MAKREIKEAKGMGVLFVIPPLSHEERYGVKFKA